MKYFSVCDDQLFNVPGVDKQLLSLDQRAIIQDSKYAVSAPIICNMKRIGTVITQIKKFT